MDSTLLFNLATSILEECKQITLNPDIGTVVYLVNRVLGPHPVPHLLRSNALIRVAEELCTKQNESPDETLPPSGGMIDECAVLLSVVLTHIFIDNVMGVLKQSSW